MLCRFVGHVLLVMAALPILPAAERMLSRGKIRRGSDVETLTKAGICEVASFAPCAEGVMGPFAGQLEPDPSKPDLWSQVELRMEQLVKKPVLDSQRRYLDGIKGSINHVREDYQSYVDLEAGNVMSGHSLMSLLSRCEKIYHDMLNSPSVQHFVLQIIPLGSLHLGLLRGRLSAGAVGFPGPDGASGYWAASTARWEGHYAKLFNTSYSAWRAVRLNVSVTDLSRHEVMVKDEYLDQVITVECYRKRSNWAWILRHLGLRWLGYDSKLAVDAKGKAHLGARSHLADLSGQMARAINDVILRSVYVASQQSSDGKHTKVVVNAPWFVNKDGLMISATIFDVLFLVGAHNNSLVFFND